MLYGLLDLIPVHWILINTIICLIVYQCVLRYWSYFSDRGIKFLRGWPILGTQYKMLLGRQAMPDMFDEVYNTFPDEAFVGMYEFGGRPVYLIRDPELIKQITIKDFDHFVNHRMDINEDSDPLMGRAMFVTKNQKWKDIRSTLSPAFTGSKMRLMLNLLNECADEYCDFLKTEIGDKTVVYNTKDLFQRFANDAIATCAFGVKVNSLKDKNNEFFNIARRISNFFEGPSSLLKMMGYAGMPKVMNFFKIKMFNESDANYLRQMVHSNIKHRVDNNVYRPDMINLLIEARKGTLIHTAEPDEDVGFATVHESDVGKGAQLQKWEDDDVTAQCLLFLLAGLNAISVSQCFLFHEMAMNPDIQMRLYNEIAEVHKTLDGKPLTYDVLKKMTYLDMVVSETLRRWVLGANDRAVNKEYVLEDSNGNKVQLNVGDSLIIPGGAIQMDPKYYPNPTKFDPERFNDENKHKIQLETFLPFGIGPRNCIGSRFALMEIKSLSYYLLKDFVVERCAMTQHPIKFKPNTAFLEPEKGFWVQIRRRNL